MTQRIQAPLNAGTCLIISREKLSMVSQKKRQRETEKNSRSRSYGGKIERRLPDHVVPLLQWLFYVYEKKFDKILLLYIYSFLLASYIVIHSFCGYS